MSELLNFVFSYDFITVVSKFLGSIYSQMVFGAWLGYQFFLKQLIEQKKADRTASIENRRDDFYKEQFDRIMDRVENVYNSLGIVRSYSTLLDYKKVGNKDILKERYREFTNAWVNLHDALHLLILSIERYDFLSEDNKNGSVILDVVTKLSDIFSEISDNAIKISFSTSQVDLSSNVTALSNALKDLVKVGSEINLTVMDVANKCKSKFDFIFVKLNKSPQKKAITVAALKPAGKFRKLSACCRRFLQKKYKQV